MGDPGEVTAIAVQGASVYWTEPAIGVIATAPVDGGEAIALVSDPSFYPWAIALDSGNLYWSDQKANGVFQLPLTGGKATRIATAPGGAGPIALNATGIYFMTGGPDCAVIRAALDGSGQQTLASGVACNSFAIAIDSASVYFGSRDSGEIDKVAIDGGSLTRLATGQQPIGLAVDAVSVYWTDVIAGAVLKAPK